jgi:chemotaxis protein MotB
MLSMANIDIQKFRELLGSVKDAFGVQFDVQGDYQAAIDKEVLSNNKNIPQRNPIVDSKNWSEKFNGNNGDGGISEQQQTVHDIRDAINLTNMGEVAEVRSGRGGIRLRLKGALLFEAGRADLKTQAFPLIDSLAEILIKQAYYLLIEGHTDAIPISTQRFPSNWELSGARAAAVLRHLIEVGVNSKRLTCVGLADSYPIADNATQDGRAKNRRVEFVLTEQPFRPEIN